MIVTTVQPNWHTCEMLVLNVGRCSLSRAHQSYSHNFCLKELRCHSQSILIFSILNHPCSCLVYYYLFNVFYLSKLLFDGFLRFEGDFALCKNDLKYRDIPPLKLCYSALLHFCICKR